MSDIVVRAEGLSKLYRLGPRQRYGSLRDNIAELAKRPFRRGRRQPPETIWALRDVTFEVASGDVIGIIGRNGAGKSTLLKILSRITEPTTGRAEVRGRVGSLLEVGTGFHPELTGRENIYLNGAILGMKRAEIGRKFDEIVSFAEVERFLDTQMKFYSSGMYVRLAFAVAAHLEPEILIVDEVLAVGDAAFQKKCLGKMSQVARGGRTVIFVSHNMSAVTAMCGRCMWLENGQLALCGDTRSVVERYLSLGRAVSLVRDWPDPQEAPGNEKVQLVRVRVVPAKEGGEELLTVDKAIVIELDYLNKIDGLLLNLSIVLYNAEGVCVFNSASPSVRLPVGPVAASVKIMPHLLNDGRYSLRVLIVQDEASPLIDLSEVIAFDVHELDRQGSWHGKWIGVVRPNLEWTHTAASGGSTRR